MRRPRRNHFATFQAKAALTALKGDQTLASLAQQFDVHPNQITQGETALLQRASEVFATVVNRREAATYIKRLHAKIDQLALENDFCPSRSVASAMRAQSDARSAAGAASDAQGEAAGAVALIRVLPATRCRRPTWR